MRNDGGELPLCIFAALGILVSNLWPVAHRMAEIDMKGLLTLCVIAYDVLLAMYICSLIWKKRKPAMPKVIGWTKYDSLYEEYNGTGSDWGDVRQAVINEIRKNGYKFGGNYHQYGLFGCPVMNDGKVFMVSMREWGQMMADVWGGTYCDYAWQDNMKDDGGKVPSKHAEPKGKTIDEILAMRRREEELRHRFEETKNNQKAKEKKERKEQVEVIKNYVSMLGRRFRGDAAGMTAFLKDELPEIVFRIKNQPYGTSMKWVFYENERERVKKEQQRKVKEFLEDIGRL